MIYGFDYFFFLMILRPPVSTRPATHFPDATLFRSGHAQGRLPGAGHADLPAQGPGPGTRASRTRPGARHDPDRRRRDLRHGLPGRHRRRVPDRIARADGDAAAAAAAQVLRPRGRGGDRAAGADPGRHGASLPAAAAGEGVGDVTVGDRKSVVWGRSVSVRVDR